MVAMATECSVGMPGKRTPFCGVLFSSSQFLLLVQGKPIDLDAEAGDVPRMLKCDFG